MLTKEGVKAEQAIPWHEYMYLRMMNRSGYMHLRQSLFTRLYLMLACCVSSA